MSEAAQNAVHSACKHNSEWYPCISGLRLGSHATRSELKLLTPEILQNRERGLIYKGILQYYIKKGNLFIKIINDIFFYLFYVILFNNSYI